MQLNGEGFEMTEKKKENMFGSWFVSLFGGGGGGGDMMQLERELSPCYQKYADIMSPNDG